MKRFKKLLSENNLASRVWDKDASVWSAEEKVQADILNRLGWLDVADWILPRIDDLVHWAGEIAQSARFDRVVVLGMGGSSLAPEVFSTLFAQSPGYPALEVLDSTSPTMVNDILAGGIERTLFIVASKSGTTLETTDLSRFFFSQLQEKSDNPGSHFVAITDGGSWLESHAAESDFLKVFVNPADIGGRYSALSYFGLVPAALYGVNIKTLVERARTLIKAARSDDPQANPCLDLGIKMSLNALEGRDKMILALPEAMSSVGAWVEQLVAESTGKLGVGIVPVCTSYPGNEPEHYPDDPDSFNVVMFNGEPGADLDTTAINLVVDSPLDIGAEFFRWEFATAIAAAGLAVNPFDEPNVSEAKQSTNRFIESGQSLPLQTTGETREYAISAMDPAVVDADSVGFADKLSSNGYVAILAYLPMTKEVAEHLEQLRYQVASYYNVVSTVGIGPRYLHSTGQLHKGGAPVGAFVQLVEPTDQDLAIPGRDYGFAELFRAQADGDFAVLTEKSLPVMRFNLKGDRLQAISSLANVFADMA